MTKGSIQNLLSDNYRKVHLRNGIEPLPERDGARREKARGVLQAALKDFKVDLADPDRCLFPNQEVHYHEVRYEDRQSGGESSEPKLSPARKAAKGIGSRKVIQAQGSRHRYYQME